MTLTLASAVEDRSDTVTVRYTKPPANPLQSASGNAVETFTDQAVTVIVFDWSTSLTLTGLDIGFGLQRPDCFGSMHHWAH